MLAKLTYDKQQKQKQEAKEKEQKEREKKKKKLKEGEEMCIRDRNKGCVSEPMAEASSLPGLTIPAPEILVQPPEPLNVICG